MSVSINIEIVSVDENNNPILKFTTKVPCDQLALMLYDWEGNCFTKNADILTKEETDLIKATYGEESISVQEEIETFLPTIVSIFKLQSVFEKIRNKIIYPNIKDSIKSGDEYETAKLQRDLIAISECIAAMEIMKKHSSLAYVGLEDF